MSDSNLTPLVKIPTMNEARWWQLHAEGMFFISRNWSKLKKGEKYNVDKF